MERQGFLSGSKGLISLHVPIPFSSSLFIVLEEFDHLQCFQHSFVFIYMDKYRKNIVFLCLKIYLFNFLRYSIILKGLKLF